FALHRAASCFAAKQIRNVATIGGNVAHCSPCADTMPPLLCHEAEALIAGGAGTRSLPVNQVAAGPYRYGLTPDEVILGFYLRPRSPDFADFQKIGRRRELVIARINMAGLADVDGKGRLREVRFALGSCTPVPQRFKQVEQMLEGQQPSEQLFWEAGALTAKIMIGITGMRPSFVYKEQAVQGLFYRMFAQMMRSVEPEDLPTDHMDKQ
ncbi:MAG: FAD binding domain-containing protein, partial [Thermodesulfobacteriota bacterium]